MNSLPEDVRSPVAPGSVSAAAESRGKRVKNLALLLDDAFRIPGTNFRIGVDPVVGVVPGLGDMLGVTLSGYIVLESLSAGAPRSMILRMLYNLAIDAGLGSVPGLGNVLDAGWKANAKNARLLLEHLQHPEKAKRASRLFWMVVLGALLLVTAGAVFLSLYLARLAIGLFAG